jgi:hypothetical protein
MPPVREALVPVLIGGRGIRCYRIERSDELVAELLEMETDWWTRYIVADRCPPADPPSLPVLRRLVRHRDIPARSVDTTLVSEWLQAKAVLKQAEANEEICRRYVLAELGDAEVGECDVGRLTYRATRRAGYTVAASIIRTLRFSPTRESRVS